MRAESLRWRRFSSATLSSKAAERVGSEMVVLKTSSDLVDGRAMQVTISLDPFSVEEDVSPTLHEGSVDTRSLYTATGAAVNAVT